MTKRLNEAEKMLDKVMAAYENQLGLEHTSKVYHSQERYTGAETLFEQVLQAGRNCSDLNTPVLSRQRMDSLMSMPHKNATTTPSCYSSEFCSHGRNCLDPT